jgi:hypothetical protein
MIFSEAIEEKIRPIVEALIEEKGYVCAVDVLLKLAYLSKSDYEAWRFGNVPYLEKVCKINLSKLTIINQKIKWVAHDFNLVKSLTVYHKYGKGPKTSLRFCKSGDKNIETAYATHFINKKRIGELKTNQISE